MRYFLRSFVSIKFSIVTPALNCAKFLARNIASVRGQGIPSDQMEHWIIDGGSTDGTVEFLNQQSGLKFISEKDRGLADAVNKGVRRSSGEWIIWLNADDELAPNALREFEKAQQAFPDVFMFCGDQKVFGYDGSLEVTSQGWDYSVSELLGRKTSILQASTFVHRTVYETVGLLDESYRYAMDYEWTVRAAHKFKCQPLPMVLTHYHRRPGSITDVGMAGQHRDFLRVRRKYSKSYLDMAEMRLRFYILTEPLRKTVWLRRLVRKIKSVLGVAPTHPIPNLAVKK